MGDNTVRHLRALKPDSPVLRFFPTACGHVYCRHYAARELHSSGQPLEADRIYTEQRQVRCRL